MIRIGNGVAAVKVESMCVQRISIPVVMPTSVLVTLWNSHNCTVCKLQLLLCLLEAPSTGNVGWSAPHRFHFLGRTAPGTAMEHWSLSVLRSATD